LGAFCKESISFGRSPAGLRAVLTPTGPPAVQPQWRSLSAQVKHVAQLMGLTPTEVFGAAPAASTPPKKLSITQRGLYANPYPRKTTPTRGHPKEVVPDTDAGDAVDNSAR